MLKNSFISSITGEVVTEPIDVLAPHKCKSIEVKVLRSSGCYDLVEVLLPYNGPTEFPEIKKGDAVRVIGVLYTYQNNLTAYPKLKICIFASSVVTTNYPTNKNIIICQGTIVKKPILRETPKSKTICDILLAVNNDIDGLYASYIPVIAWNKKAREIAECHIGSKVQIIGRLQSREYNKVLNDISTTYTTKELSINSFKLIED